MTRKEDDVYLPEVLYEIRSMGRFLRVTAIDPISATEIVAVCDATYSPAMVKRLAARKLKYVMRKRGVLNRPHAPRGRRGIVV
ncbi:MAG: hypothetical protein VW268_03350 [Rhodospirillaceae bacterium]